MSDINVFSSIGSNYTNRVDRKTFKIVVFSIKLIYHNYFPPNFCLKTNIMVDKEIDIDKAIIIKFVNNK